MARQRLGQHFLADLHWREEIARAIRVSRHSTVPLPRDDQHCWIEIGSGHGEMTQHLLAAGAPVHAIEIDPMFIAGLRHLAQEFSNLTVIPGDILEADLAAIASGGRIRLYASLRDRVHVITATFPSSPSSTRVPNLSSKFLGKHSRRHRKSPRPSSPSACPANAQSCPSATYLVS